MAFKGDLNTIGLADIFQTLHLGAKEGTLVVRDAESEKRIRFGRSGVSLISTGKRKGIRIGDYLIRAGKITPAQLESALRDQSEGKRLGTVLVEKGWVNPQDIQQAVRGQIEEEIYDLFSWRNAAFEFIEGTPDEGGGMETMVKRMSFDVNSILMEAMRRLDEWHVITQRIPTLHGVPVPADGVDAAGAGADGIGTHLWPALDGIRDIEEIATAASLGRFDVCRTLSEWVAAGKVRLLAADEIVAKGRELLSGGRAEEGMALLRKAEAVGPPTPELHRDLAQALKLAGKTEDAARHARESGRGLAEAGKHAEALAAYRAASAIDPGDRDAALETVRTLRTLGRTEEAKGESESLLRRLENDADAPRGVALARMLVEDDPKDLLARFSLAGFLALAGDAAGAAAEVDDAIRRLPADPERQVGYLARALQAVPNHAEARRRMDQARNRNLRAQGSRLGRLAVTAVILAVAAAGAAWFFYEREASARLDEIFQSAKAIEEEAAGNARGAVAEGNLDAFHKSVDAYGRARDKILEFKTLFRWSFLAERRVDAELARLSAVDRDLETAWTQKRTETVLDLEKRLKEADENHQSGVPERVRRALEEYSVLLPQAQRLGEEKLADEIGRRVSGAAEGQDKAGRLVAQAQAAEAAGDFRKACALIRELKTNYGSSPAAIEANYPVRVDSIPTGASVFRGGVDVGKTPLTLRWDGAEPLALRLTRPGFGILSRSIDDPLEGLAVLTLSKAFAWRYKTNGVIESAAPAAWRDLIVAGSRDGRLYALDAEGRPRWTFKADVGGDFLSTPRVIGDRIVVGSNDGNVYAIDPARGEAAWKRKTGGFVRSSAAAAPGGDRVYIGSADGKLYALRAADGELLWSLPLSGEINGPVAFEEGRILAACENGAVHAVVEETGDGRAAVAWTAKTGGAVRGGVAAGGGLVLAGAADGTVHAFRLADGTAAWTWKSGGEIVSTPAVADGRAFLSSRDGSLQALDLATGKPVWKRPTGGPISGSPVVRDGVVYVGGEDQKLYAVDAATGDVRWVLAVDGRLRSTPCVTDRLVVIGSDDKSLYAAARD